ncbi:MAG: helix-turn-helix domain-containing protein [Clostridia bacterium]|nr:helix-turn-helix domain-containing protein [Clostridia bacterium]
MDMQKIGNFLAELRKSKNLTQDELGEQIGVTNKTVSRWENGNYLPPVEMLQMLSKLYDVSINELLSGARLND